MISTTDAAGSTIDVQTDSLGRVVSISGDTPTQRFLYWTDGLARAQIDELNRRTERNYDQRGRLISVTQPTPSSSIAIEPASVTTYQYTVDSLLSSVTDPLGRVTSFTHDAGGRVSRITEPDPDGGVTAVNYDIFGNTLSVTAPLGNVTGYSYNKFNQRVTESKGSADRTYLYDDRSQLVSAATTAIAGMTPPFGLPGGEGYDFDAGGNRRRVAVGHRDAQPAADRRHV